MKKNNPLYRILLITLFLGSFTACKTSKKQSLIQKAYHNITAHYNGYFNAKLKIDQVAAQSEVSIKDQYDQLLPIYKKAAAASTGENTKGSKAGNQPLDEAIKNSQSVPEQTAKQVDAKGQLIAKQVQGMDARLQQQANVLKALSTQLQNIQGAVGDTGGLKREMEALAKLQRERQTVETTANSQASAAAAAAAAAVRQREKMVQYPRVQQDATPSGSAGVLSTKP